MFMTFRELWIGLIVGAVALIVFAIIAATGWPGQPDYCLVEWEDGAPTGVVHDPHFCYCETTFELSEVQNNEPGIRQDANTWSNLALLFMGLAMALWTGVARHKGRLDGPSRMNSDTLYPLIFSLAVGFMGPGSMFFHASLTRWGGWVDMFSMFLFANFLLTYGLCVRLCDEDDGLIPFMRFCDRTWREGLLFGLVYAALSVGFMFIVAYTDIQERELGHLLLGPGILWAGLELIYIIVKGIKDGWRHRFFWYIGAVLSLGLAFVFWGLSKSPGDPWCSLTDGVFTATSALQAHGIWHTLAGVMAVLLFFYFRVSEDG